MISIDMPAGPSELLVIADEHSNPAYVASDLLSQAEHGVDSQVVLIASDVSDAHLAKIEEQVRLQGEALPRSDIVRESIGKSFVIRVKGREEAMRFSNSYAPEHLILHVEDAEGLMGSVDNAGSVFVGHWSPERYLSHFPLHGIFSFCWDLTKITNFIFDETQLRRLRVGN